MFTILALTVVGSWTYSGFLDEPSRVVAAPSAAPKVPAPQVDIRPTERPAPRVQASATSPPPMPPAPPSLYRLSDATGQAWEHADPAALAGFVEARNRSMTFYPSSTFRSGRAARCSGGSCP